MDEYIHIPDAGRAGNLPLLTGLCLSLATLTPVRFTGLTDDGSRKQAGLGPSGLMALMAAAKVSGGDYNAKLGGLEASFLPDLVQSGDILFTPPSNRAATPPVGDIMVMLAPPMAKAEGRSTLIVNGATHTRQNLTTDEVSRVMAPVWGTLGIKARQTEISPGFWPKGGGEAELVVDGGWVPKSLAAEAPFTPIQVGVDIVISGLPVHLAEQAAEGAEARLLVHGYAVKPRIRKARGGLGMAVLVWSSGGGLAVGFSEIGQRGGRPEALAVSAVEKFTSFLKTGAGMPTLLAARLLPALALAPGVSRISVPSLGIALQNAARAVNAFWPGTVILEESNRNAQICGLRVVGRGWEES